MKQIKPILIVGNDPIVVDIELIVWEVALDIFVNLRSDVLIAGLIHVECVVIGTLIYHLIDNIPVDHSELIEMIQRFVNVIVNNLLKLQTKSSWDCYQVLTRVQNVLSKELKETRPGVDKVKPKGCFKYSLQIE